MDFVKELKLIDFSEEFKGYEWIQVNEVNSLSIQASKFHYSIPKENIDADKYTHFELAIVYKDKITKDTEILNNFNRKSELLEYKKGPIYAYVPKDLINDLYLYLIMQ